MKVLAQEIREAIIKRDAIHGGHFGPNLGIVEATIALHYVFESPKDKFVFDVSHQTYPHKILTGRREAFTDEAHYDDVTGYSNQNESEHDHFILGHTSTSISLALGLAKARDVKGETGNVVAIVGDGSLSGGEALEGLDFAGGELKSNFIIVVNDNEMSIAENHGGLYKNLKLLRETEGKAECNLFKAIGLEYIFIKDGNNLEELIETLKKVKDINHPIVVHIYTQKGKGYKLAEEDKESWHYTMPFNIENGKPLNEDIEDYCNITKEYLIKKMKEDKTVVTITAGTPGDFGFSKKERDELGSQFVDVGIAEQTAVAMS